MDDTPPVNQPAKPATPTPIRDVAAPAAPPKQPDMSVHEPTNQPSEAEADHQKPTEVVRSEQHKPAATPEYPGSGLAICAAVVIVLVIAGLITYAYLRTQNIALF